MSLGTHRFVFENPDHEPVDDRAQGPGSDPVSEVQYAFVLLLFHGCHHDTHMNNAVRDLVMSSDNERHSRDGHAVTIGESGDCPGTLPDLVLKAVILTPLSV